MLQRSSSSYGVHRKFREHERLIRVALGAAESNPSSLRALQPFRMHLNVMMMHAKP